MALAEDAAPAIVTGEGPRRMSALEVEHDNLDAALEWADASGAQEYMLRLATALALFFELRGHLASGCQWFARALEPDGSPSVVRAHALWGAAHVALYAHDFATFTRRAPEALAMAESVGDPWTAARALNARGYAELWFDPEQGRITLEHSVALGRDIDDAWAVADGLKMTSVALLTQTRLDEARTVLDALHDVARGSTTDSSWPGTTRVFGTIAWFRGDVDQAREQFELALHHCRLVGDPSTGGIAASWLAEIEALTGHYDAADERLHGLLARRPDDDDFDPDEPTTIALLPWLCTAAIQLQHSRSSNHSSIRRTCSRFRCGPRGRRLSAEQPSSPLMTKKAPRLRSPSRVGSLARRSTVPGSYHKPIINSPCWPVAPAGPMRPSASTMSRSAVQSEHGYLPGVAESLEALASLALEGESPLEAARLFGAAGALLTRLGVARWPADEANHDRDLARLRAALGAEFDAAWNEGNALTVDNAVAYATRARGERKRPSSGWDSLTPTERQVVELAAEGLTNPQIADGLFIARGTVKAHLGHVFPKLGVTTRAELAVLAVRRADDNTT